MSKLFKILSLVLLRVFIVNSSDNKPPYFLSDGDFSSFSIPENFQIGTSVYKLKGFDPEGKKISYSISGPYFAVERDTGIVKLIKELDRETQSELETIIIITDEAENLGEEPNTVSVRRIIPIRDFNDFPPSFLGRPYSAKVLETSKIGHIVETSPITVIDKDEGVNAEVTLSCYRGGENNNNNNREVENSCDYFDVVTIKRGEGNYTVQIRLLKPIDYETKKSYTLTIIARDGSRDNPLSSNATININVVDAQDQPPIFFNSPYTAMLEENWGPNELVLAINATDGDFGSLNNIILTLEREKFGYFKLLKSGQGQAQLITSEIPIDRENPEILENGGYYTFFVRATEAYRNHTLGDSSVTTITINIQDVDDNIPEFNKPFFNLTIPEKLEQEMALPKLSIQVNDRDGILDNNKYNLTISNVENAEGIFEITPKEESHGRTQVIVKVRNSSRLDYDVGSEKERTFVFEIIATVNFIPLAKTTVEIHLEGINDHFPTFEQSNYRLQVSENVEVGTAIGENLSAIDKDVGVYGQLRYVLRGFGSSLFRTNSEKGGLYVKNNLDFEQQKSYNLIIIARDAGGRETSANIFIDVLDVNDNYPQFEMTEYYRSVREGAKSFEPQFFVKAHDVDGVMQGNGRVSYTIESENSISGHIFAINAETGEIFIKEVVHSSDTFDGNYELMICAKDFGVPHSLKNYTKVIIRVGSENQRPIFQGHFASHDSIPGPPFHRLSIYENAKFGSNLTIVHANDPDGDDKLLRYRITEPSDSFQIDEISGLITISPYARLDRDLSESYSITVFAIDAGIPRETSTVTINVKILDVNNKAPKFCKASYTAYVPERNKGMEVLRVEALDSDLNAKLKYSIIQPVYATTKAGFKLNPTNFDYKSIFKINEDTASIVLMKNLESSGLYSVTLTARVEDINALNGTEQSDTSEVIFYIQNFKESGPIFLNDGWNQIEKKLKLNVNEEMPIGSVIMAFEAVDPFSGAKIYDFEMEEGASEAQRYFNLQDNKLVISSVIDYESIEKKHFAFDIKAISHDSFSIAHLSIEIQNTNDNSPIFERNFYKAAVLESIKESEVILKVKASDKDALRDESDKFSGYSHITYSLAGANSALFDVSREGGEIRLAKNQSLDREKLSMIHFQVIAEDSFGKPLTAKKSFVNVSIEVLDINDNAPKLLNPIKNGVIVTVVSESLPLNSLILLLESSDADEGLAAEVRYEMVNDGELKSHLNLNYKTGELTTAKLFTGRGRSEPYEIVIRAIDNGNQIPKQRSLFTDQIIHIFIGDTFQNDGIPYFITPQDEEASVLENSPVGTKVYQVLAKDPDNPSTPSGMLHYRIQNDIDDAHYFKIEPLTGIILTTQVLDRETKSKYNVIVEVTDQGEPIQMATRVLIINVLDVDDEIPLFERDIHASPVEFSLLEEQSGGVILGNVTAIDKDSDENAVIDYEIIDGNELEFFKLIVANNSALITTTQAIDREEYGNFLLTIKCFKMATHWQRLKNSFTTRRNQHYNASDFSEIRVSVNVLDIDDHILEFERPVYTLGIRNTIPINTQIYRVQAYDKDTANLPIFYRVSNVSYVSQYHRKDAKLTDDMLSIFELNNKTGEILLAKAISNYVDGHFVLDLAASNNQYSHSETIVKIFVVRDKSIMKFVFSKSPHAPNQLGAFAEKLQNKLNETELEILIFDAQVLSKPEKALDFVATSACFKLLRNGNSLSAQETRNILNSEEMKNQLRETYIEYGVESIELCSFGSKEVAAQAQMMGSSGNWLVFLAFLVLIASIISTLAAFCLFKRTNAVPHMNIIKSPILHQRISNPDIYNDGNMEPIYTIM